MSSERSSGSHIPITERIASLYTSDAQKVAQLLLAHPLVLVCGFYESGKTTFFKPQLTQQLAQRNVVTGFIDATMVGIEQVPEAVRSLPPNTGALILDESGAIKDVSLVKDILNTTKQLSMPVAAMTGYSCRSKSSPSSLMAEWQSGSRDIHGEIPPIHVLSPKRLDSDMAREVLTRQPDRNITSPEVAEIIISNIPLYLPFLDKLSSCRNPEEVIRQWREQWHMWMNIISSEEYDGVLSQLRTAVK